MTDIDNAPIHYNNDEAHAWIAGHEAAMQLIERIIEDERRTHRLADTRENGFVVAVLDGLLDAIRQEDRPVKVGEPGWLEATGLNDQEASDA